MVGNVFVYWRAKMKEKASKILEITVYSINYILISYALSNIAMAMKRSPVFILFFASDIWVMGEYMKKMYGISKNRIIAGTLGIVCFAVHMGLGYFLGRIVGDIVPFAV